MPAPPATPQGLGFQRRQGGWLKETVEHLFLPVFFMTLNLKHGRHLLRRLACRGGRGWVAIILLR